MQEGRWTREACRGGLPCHDCASVELIYEGNARISHGGNWNAAADQLPVATTAVMEAGVHLRKYGLGCAEDAPEDAGLGRQP